MLLRSYQPNRAELREEFDIGVDIETARKVFFTPVTVFEQRVARR